MEQSYIRLRYKKISPQISGLTGSIKTLPENYVSSCLMQTCRSTIYSPLGYQLYIDLFRSDNLFQVAGSLLVFHFFGPYIRQNFGINKAFAGGMLGSNNRIWHQQHFHS